MLWTNGMVILSGVLLLEISGKAHALECCIVSDQSHFAVLEIIQKLLRERLPRGKVNKPCFPKAAALIRCPGNQQYLKAGVGNVAVQATFLDVSLAVGFNINQCFFQSSSPRSFHVKRGSRSSLPVIVYLAQVVGQFLAGIAAEDFLIILQRIEIRLRRGTAGQTVAVLDELDIAKASRHAAIAVGVEGVEVDTYIAVAAGVDHHGVKDMLQKQA